jgi:hypothetical protein
MIPAVPRLRDFRRVFWAQVISRVGDFFVPALNEILSGFSIGVDGTLWETTLQRNVPPEALCASPPTTGWTRRRCGLTASDRRQGSGGSPARFLRTAPGSSLNEATGAEVELAQAREM